MAGGNRSLNEWKVLPLWGVGRMLRALRVPCTEPRSSLEGGAQQVDLPSPQQEWLSGPGLLASVGLALPRTGVSRSIKGVCVWPALAMPPVQMGGKGFVQLSIIQGWAS